MARDGSRTAARPRRHLLALTAVALLALVAGLVVGATRDGSGPGSGAGTKAPRELRAAGLEALAYDPARRAELEDRAAAGFSQPLFDKSPGGAIASAQRTMRWRPVIDRVAAEHDLPADDLEALVLLESAGRPDARASADLSSAVGLTQILAQTATGLLDMHVDLERSARLTRLIDAGGSARAQRRRQALRAQADERFDPRKSLEATGRYLDFARKQLGGRVDLALASYHMGVGNLQDALRRYDGAHAQPIPYAQLYFDSSPLRHPSAWSKLASLGDDSSTYLWRLGAARDILALQRKDPDALATLQDLHARGESRELVLHPPGSATEYADVAAATRAREQGALVAAGAAELGRHGLRPGGPAVSDPALRALRPEALAVLRIVGDGTRSIGRTGPLTVTSSLATEPSGWSFDLARRYRTPAQAQALQFLLDRLTAFDLIAYARQADTLHVTVGPRARELVRG